MDQSASRVLPDIGQVYIDRVMAEYDLLPPEKTSRKNVPDHIASIVKKFPNERDQISWGDLVLLEKYVLSKQPLEVLKQRLATLRDNYRDVVGQKSYDEYLLEQSSQNHGSAPLADTLRADLSRLLDALHWAYFMTRKREEWRTHVIRNIGAAIVLLFIPVGLAYFSLYRQDLKLTATIVAVLFMGALGGFVSLQQRIQSIPTEGDPVLTLFELKNGQFSLYFAPLTGAIFALLMFLMFVGGLLKGSLFPEFSNLQLDPVRYGNLFDYSQYGKLMVWSFIVGFAERFVPDTLTVLVGRAQRTASAQINGTVAPTRPSGIEEGSRSQTDSDENVLQFRASSANHKGRDARKKR